MKIVHFSDIHEGGWFSGLSGFFDKRLIGALNYHLRRKKKIHYHWLENAIKKIHELKPDLVVCTGDFTSISEISEFQKAVDHLSSLMESKDFIFFSVPGNHDYYLEKKTLKDKAHASINLLNQHKFKLEDFPIRQEIKNVEFILIDESIPCNLLNSYGEFKKKDETILKKWLEEDKKKTRILLSHFPLFDKNGKMLPEKRHLKNAQFLQEHLQKGTIDIALCGHIHAPFIREESCGSKEICAGSLTMNGMMNFLEIDEKIVKQKFIDCRI